MMKKIFITAIALLVSVSAYAVDLKLKGGMNVEGNYESNYGLAADDTYSHMYYGQELKIVADLVISEDTQITTRLDIYKNDEDPYVWGTREEMDAYDGKGGDAFDSIMTAKRAYMTHKFPTKTTLKLGLMDGDQWAYSFGDDKSGRWRVTVQQETPFGHLFGVLEKRADQGFLGQGGAEEDAETDDYDVYYLAGITKIADLVFVKPLFAYGQIGNAGDYADLFAAMPNDGEVDGTIVAFDLGLDGTLEDMGLGFEMEFIYKTLMLGSDFKDILEVMGESTDDLTMMGFYFNGWMNIDPAKVGMWVAYGSFDEDTGAAFNFDDDFDSTTILGDDLGGRIWEGLINQVAAIDPAAAGEINDLMDLNSPDDLMACTAIQLYADVAIPSLEKLTVSPSFTYVMSNIDDDDTTAFEIDIDCAYAITDALTYGAGIAYASITYDMDGIDDPDGIVKLYHNFNITF